MWVRARAETSSAGVWHADSPRRASGVHPRQDADRVLVVHPPEDVAEELTVVGRQRREQLVGGLTAGGAHVVADGLAPLGQVQEDRAPVGRVDLAPHQARLL